MGHAISRTRPSIVAFDLLAREPSIDVFWGGSGAASIDATPQPATKQNRKIRFIRPLLPAPKRCCIRLLRSRRLLSHCSPTFVRCLVSPANRTPVLASGWDCGFSSPDRRLRQHGYARLSRFAATRVERRIKRGPAGSWVRFRTAHWDSKDGYRWMRLLSPREQDRSALAVHSRPVNATVLLHLVDGLETERCSSRSWESARLLRTNRRNLNWRVRLR